MKKMALFLKFSLVLVFIIALSPKPYPISCLGQDDKTTFLTVHNEARAQVKVGPISWDNKLESYAQEFANTAKSDCIPQGRPKGGPYGENRAEGYGAFNALEAAGEWVAEKDNYDYASNKCVKGECKHYTQVVWRNSTRLGCASVLCGAGWPFVVCEYDPPGNIPGQRPY